MRRNWHRSSKWTAAVAAAILLAGVAPTAGIADAAVASSVVVAGDTLTLRWAEHPSAVGYVVVDDYRQQVLVRSSQNEAELAISASDAVALLVVAITDNGPVILEKVLVTVPEAGSARTVMSAVTTPSGTHFTWGALSGVTTYLVDGTGIPPATLTTPAVDLPVSLGETANFEMHAKPALTTTITDRAVTDISYGIEITPPVTDVSSISVATAPGDTLPADIPKLIMSSFKYETYIPYKYIDAPEDGYAINCESGDHGEDWWYNGNDRDKYDYNVGKHKSLTRVHYHWTRSSTETYKNVSATKRYKKVGSTYYYDSTRSESSDDVIIRPIDNDGRVARTAITHEIGNPYCTPIAEITYEQAQTAYQHGGYSLNGQHDRMPNHQQYRRNYYSDGSSSFRLIFDHPLKDPACLNPIYGEMYCGGMWEYQYQS